MSGDLFYKFTKLPKPVLMAEKETILKGDGAVKYVVDANEADLLRKRKFAEIVKESEFKTLGEVMDKHPVDFDPEVIDAIPLRNGEGSLFGRD